MSPEVIDISQALSRLDAIGGEVAQEIKSWLQEDQYEDCEVDWYEGDLRVERFIAGPHLVVVNGDLIADGLVEDGHETDAPFLAVMGAFEAEHFCTCGLTIIGTNALIRGLLYANSLNDFSLEVGGDLTSKALIEGGHFCKIGGRINCQFTVRTQNQIVSEADKDFEPSDALGAVLSSELIDASGKIPLVKERALIARLSAGETPFYEDQGEP